METSLRERWLYGGSNYWRLAEPLDIAMYYRAIRMAEIYIKIRRGKTISLVVGTSDTIRNLKLKIPLSEWIHGDLPDLFYKGEHLNDNRTLGSYNISWFSTLECRWAPKISITTMSGETISLEVASFSTTIGNLKAQIQDKVDIIPQFQQWLFFDGRHLDNNCTLADYKIKDGSTLLLMRRSKEWIPIYVKTYDGKTISLEVKISDTIGDLKFKLKEVGAIDPFKPNLFLTGEQLLNTNCTLNDYNIHHVSLSSFSLPGSAADSYHCLRDISVSADDSFHRLMDTSISADYFVHLLFDKVIMASRDDFDYDTYEGRCIISCIRRLMPKIIMYITTRPGNTISLEVSTSDTIRDVKLKIPPSEWNHRDLPDLVYNRVHLNDNRTLESYNIFQFSTLECWLGMKISVRTMSGKTVSVEVASSNTTIGNLKAHIQDKEGVPQFQQKLFFDGRQLENNCTLADYKIKEGFTLLLMCRLEGWIQIYVKTLTEKPISVEFKSSDTIGDVKVKIKDMVGVPPYNQTLFFAGEGLLVNCRTLYDYHIHSESTLSLVPVRRGRMKIYVETISGNTIPLDVFSRYTIGEVKSLIQDKEGIPTHTQTLVYAHQKLDDSRILVYYRIQNETTLRLVDNTLMRREPMQIHVEIVATGRTIPLQVQTFDTINSVKSKIQSQENIPYEQQRLFLPQIQLRDDYTLADYYIQNESTLHLFVTLIKIAVKTPVGKIITIDVDSSDTVWNVKAKIQDVEEVPRDYQKLFLAEEREQFNHC